MCDVTRTNFTEVLPGIRQVLKKADFICIDTEFTVLVSDEQNKASLFDDGCSRYRKYRQTASHSLPCQVGLAIFTTESPVNKNCYKAHVYNFYLLPRAFGPIDTRFILQTSSVQFLCRNKFDFNKVFYEGISYMNKEQEAKLLTHIRNNDHFEGLGRDDDEFVMQDLFTEVVNWHVRETKEPLLLDLPNGVRNNNKFAGCVGYVVVEEIRLRFPDVWASMMGDKVLVDKVDEKKRAELEKEEVDKDVNQRQIFVDDMLGFSRLVRDIITSRKPLVGHNMFMDLVLFYDKFWRSLPARYGDFKSAVHKIFPNIYDTKHISSSMRKELDAASLKCLSSLEKLYECLISPRSVQLHLFSPHITMASGHETYVKNRAAHEAGYDAYMAGVVFLHLCHHRSMADVKASEALKMGFKEYMSDIITMANRVNLIRGTVNNVNFAGSDPKSTRPAWLVVTAKKGIPLNPSLLARAFSKYGSVDIRRESRVRAYVAVDNKGCAKDILRASKCEELYTVRQYSVWKHSRTLRNCLWFGLAVAGGVCLWTVYSATVTSPPQVTSPS